MNGNAEIGGRNAEVEVKNSEWMTVCLGDMVEIDRSGSDAARLNAKDYYLGLEHLDSSGGINWNQTVESSGVKSNKYRFTSEHILFGKLRPYLRKVVRPSMTGVCSTDILPLLPKSGFNRDFIFHLLRTDDTIQRATQACSGANLPRLSPNRFRAFEFRVPRSPVEQKRIAAILDQADAIRRKRRQALQLTDDFLRSLFLDMFGDPVKNPKGWPTCKIGDLMESVNYGSSRKASSKGRYPMIRMGNITYQGGWDFRDLKYIDLDGKEQARHLVHKGEILFNRTNSKELVGKTAVFHEDEPMAFAGYLVRGITNDQSNPEYISAYMNSKHGKTTLQGMCKNIVGMANINAKEFRGISILKPPVALQDKFSNIVNEMRKRANRLNQFGDISSDLFAALQQRAFKGEL